MVFLSQKWICLNISVILWLVGFDGWLLNIENPIEKDHVENLLYLVQKLTQSMHEALPNSEVIWYDSVTIDGELKWQNQLNEVGSSRNIQISSLSRSWHF